MKTCSCSQTGARRCLCPSIHRDRSHRHEELARKAGTAYYAASLSCSISRQQVMCLWISRALKWRFVTA